MNLLQLLLLLLVPATSSWSAIARPTHTPTAPTTCVQRLAPPQALLSSLSPPPFWSAFRREPNAVPSLTIRSAMPDDLPALTGLCTDSFFGTHEFADGPIIFAQRSVIYAKVFLQLSRRIRIEEGRECRLLVAVDETSGALRGCIDLAVHLFDRQDKLFNLLIDEMPDGGGRRYAWLPYVASLAVSPESRRQGIARRLMFEAEQISRRWGYPELCLEVSQKSGLVAPCEPMPSARTLRRPDPPP